MRDYAKLLRATVAALLMLVVPVVAASAGPFEDGIAAAERGDYATEYRLLRPLADQGNAPAQNSLGFMYARGQGVPRSYSEAVKWWRKAADQGFADAQNNVGGMYYNGPGIPHNYTEAATWFRKAANQGHAAAQSNLGVMCAKGEGVLRNDSEAVNWLRKAADQGDADAQWNLGVLTRTAGVCRRATPRPPCGIARPQNKEMPTRRTPWVTCTPMAGVFHRITVKR